MAIPLPLLTAGAGAAAGLIGSLFSDNEPSDAEKQLTAQASADAAWGRGLAEKGTGYIDAGLNELDRVTGLRSRLIGDTYTGLQPTLAEYQRQTGQAGQGMWDASRQAGGFGQRALDEFYGQGLDTNLGIANLGPQGLASYSADDMRALGLKEPAIRAATMMQGRAQEEARRAELSNMALQSAQAAVGGRNAMRYGGGAGSAARFANMMYDPRVQAGQVGASEAGRAGAFNRFAQGASDAWSRTMPLGQQGLAASSQGALMGGQAAEMPWRGGQAGMQLAGFGAQQYDPSAAMARVSAGQGLANYGSGVSQGAMGLQYKSQQAAADREVGWLPMMLAGAQAGASLGNAWGGTPTGKAGA